MCAHTKKRSVSMPNYSNCKILVCLDCSTPSDPEYGVFNVTSTVFGSVATLTCDPGYVPTRAFTTCGDNGSWKDSPTCTPIGIAIKYLY